MKKLSYLTVLVTVLAVIVLGAAQDTRLANASVNGHILWQIGVFDGPVDPIDGSLEFPPDDQFFPAFMYTASGIDETPSFPGVISDRKLSQVLAPGDTRPLTNAAEVVIIQFSLNSASNTVTLYYDRYGSETDELSLDGTVIATVFGTVEEGFHSHTFNVGPISAGSHSLVIAYKGGGPTTVTTSMRSGLRPPPAMLIST